jgi:hypothetical protein
VPSRRIGSKYRMRCDVLVYENRSSQARGQSAFIRRRLPLRSTTGSEKQILDFTATYRDTVEMTGWWT